MSLRKGEICIGIILLISVLGITTINALNTPEWHTADKISMIKQSCPSGTCLWDSQWTNTIVNLEEITPLKTAISWTFNYLDYRDTVPMVGGHNASQIWVKVRPTLVNDYQTEMTLLKALKSSWGLCPPDDIIDITYSGPTDKTLAYHYATEVEVTIDGVTESLQDAINGGTFCYSYYWVISDWSGEAGCGYVTQTRTYYCARSDGVSVENSYCEQTTPAPLTHRSNLYDPCHWTFIETRLHQPYTCPAFQNDISYFWNGPIACSDYGSWNYGYSAGGEPWFHCRQDVYQCLNDFPPFGEPFYGNMW